MSEDDVIARMEYVMQDLEYASEWERPCFDKLIVAALRAVHDTHRLVPVEPTPEVERAIEHWLEDYNFTRPLWEDVLKAAPDYTLPFGEDTADVEGS